MNLFAQLFGGQSNSTPASTQTQAASTPQPGNLPASAPATTPPEGGATNINDVNPASTGAAEQSPLDKYSKLWENDPNANADANQPIGFNVDQAKLLESASKVDFAKVLKPEDLTAIAGGGDSAVQAFQKSLNAVAQSVYAQSAFATSKIVEQALAQAETKFNSKIPDIIKRNNLSNSLREENPALAHPAAAPILQSLESQLTVKYPNATNSEIKKMATEYLSSFASVVSPTKPSMEDQNKASKESDWSNFLPFN